MKENVTWKEKVAWIWFHELKGLTLAQKKQLLAVHQTPLAIYNLPIESLQVQGGQGFQESQGSHGKQGNQKDQGGHDGQASQGVDGAPIDSTFKSLCFTHAEEIYEKSSKLGIEIFTLDDAYRAGFEASHRLWPLVIYYRGNPPSSQAVAMIGTRDLSAMGYYFVQEILDKLKYEHLNVYAGFAAGVEKVAIEGALKKKLHATAVLTHGLDTCYPKRQFHMMEKLIHHGTLISPFPIGAKPNKYVFPVRNQLLALLTKQTILVEAPLTSNSLSIAQLAHQYGRPVLTIKGPSKTTKCAGNNVLLKSKIAQPMDVRLKQDISLHFQNKVAQSLKTQPMSFDQIIETFGSEYPDLTTLLLMLEHNRIVSLNSSGKWIYNGW